MPKWVERTWQVWFPWHGRCIRLCTKAGGRSRIPDIRSLASHLLLLILQARLMSTRRHRRRDESESPPAAPADPVLAAKEAGLRYADDRRPGITEARPGKAFRYLDAEGRPIRDEETLAADQEPGHPAGLDRRLDLALAAGPHPGDRPRRQGAQAISLPPPLAHRARREQVRSDDRLRPRPCRGSASDLERDLALPGPAARARCSPPSCACWRSR